jgi:hypothetical protein
MEHRHDHFGGAAIFLLVEIGRDSAAIVLDRATTIIVDDHIDAGAITGKGFIDGVIHHLVDHLVEAAAIVGVTYIHAGALAHGLEVSQYGDVVSGVCIDGFMRNRGNSCGHQDSLFWTRTVLGREQVVAW